MANNNQKNTEQGLKPKKTSLLMIVIAVAGLLAVASGAFAISSFNQNRFGGIWHLRQAGVLPENSNDEFFTQNLDQLGSCSIPTEVSNNTADSHYESQCFYMNISNIRRQAFKLYIFKNNDAKVRYYGSDLSRHPCRLGETPLIESDLYVMRPENQLVRKQERVEAIYAKLKEVDNQAIILQKGNAGSDYSNCDDHIEAIASQYRQIGAGSPVISDAAIDQRCAALQTSIDSVYSDNPVTPSAQAFADCLDLQGDIRQDFIDSLVIADKDDPELSPVSISSPGWYSPPEGPVVVWNKFDTVASLALVALHEYLHKVYFEDLSSSERIKLNQEILRLIDTDDPGTILPSIIFPQEQWDKLTPEQKVVVNPYGCSDTDNIMMDTGLCAEGDNIYNNSEYSVFVDYFGQESLNNEVMIRIGRHRPTPYHFISVRDTFRQLEDNITDRSQMVDEMLAVLPEELRSEYAGFLLDDYGLVAFMREVYNVVALEDIRQSLEEAETNGNIVDSGLAELDIVDSINYDKRLATITAEEISLQESLEEVLLSYYEDSSYDEDYIIWEEHTTSDDDYDSFTISKYIAEACGPECDEDSEDSDFPEDCALAGCDYDTDYSLQEYCQQEDYQLDSLCVILERCAENQEDPICQLLEYCLSADLSPGLDDVCNSALFEYCSEDYEAEVCHPDWSDDNAYCQEDVSDLSCWPGLEDYDEEPESDEDCFYDENGDLICDDSSSEEEDCAEDSDEDQCYIDEPGLYENYQILDDIYTYRMESILVEGYPIIALEVKESLPSWFEQHLDRFLEERQNLADYFRRRS